ncbi:MAG: response regulator [Kofleriaceae bacterium]|nr:response regulator [Kofleriaceae bacterium]
MDEIVDAVLGEIVALGFGAVWLAVLDEPSGHLVTLKEQIDGKDTTHEMPRIFALDLRQPIGHGFQQRRMINIKDPGALAIIESPDDPVAEGTLALPRVIYEHIRGHPFACGPLLGSRGQAVGALGLSSYQGNQPIPDSLFQHGLLRAFMDHLGIAMERADQLARLERLHADLITAQGVIEHDARIKAVGELTAAVAHDLNNLSGIALLAISTGMRSPGDAFSVLPRIERANRAIGELVARLQRVARATGPTPIESANLSQIVDDVVVMVSPILREHSISLHVDFEPVAAARADPSMLHQIVLNLVLNAQDALATVSEDRRKLRIGVHRHDLGVRLSVEDDGPGIAPEVLAQLFQPFITTKQGKHIGLGLAAAHESLKHFGGTIEGRNRPEGGAVFEVTLGLAPPPAPAETLVKSVTTHRHGAILAVDDDEDIVWVIRAYLEPFGYEVASTTDPEEALSLATDRAFDLVLCDVGMPKRSGLDVCHTLREGGFPGKLVLMTGWDSEVLRQNPRAREADMILKKPLLGPDLLRAIDSLLVT